LTRESFLGTVLAESFPGAIVEMAPSLFWGSVAMRDVVSAVILTRGGVVRGVGLVLVLLLGCECGPGDSGQGGDGGATVDGGADAAGNVDAGVVTGLQLLLPGSPSTLSCQQATVRTIGPGGRTPVSADLTVQLDGGRWLSFYEGSDCQGAEVTSLVVPARQSELMFRFRPRAFGMHSVSARGTGLATGSATLLATAQVGFTDATVVVPSGGCFAGPGQG
jgi:hypothetical protein